MTLVKKALVLALAGTVTITAATASFAQQRRVGPAPATGMDWAAALGPNAAATYYAPGYRAGYGAFAYSPDAYSYAPVRGQFGNYDSGYKGCATDGQYNRTDYSAC